MKNFLHDIQKAILLSNAPKTDEKEIFEMVELKNTLKSLRSELEKVNERQKELHHEIYNIQKKLGYYAKNEILYGVEYD